MDLRRLDDSTLLKKTKNLAQTEREILMDILHHLKEVDRRKLYADLGCKSLFDYAVTELNYSEGQAGRRIQALRALRELPEIENRIETGALNLSNISQAQSFFREIAKSRNPLAREEKLKIFSELENKSARDGQKVLIARLPEVTLPLERVRQLTETRIQQSFVVTKELSDSLEEVRSLLGFEGAAMSFAELVHTMAKLAVEKLKEKRFGRRRIQESVAQTPALESMSTRHSTAQEKNPRYIPSDLRYQVWLRDGGKCTNCQNTRTLNYDHIWPVALGGHSTLENLRLLCFNCNQRESLKVFGEPSPLICPHD